MKSNAPFSHAHGMTLIEVMIALLILAIGLLGVAALQSRGQQYTAAAQVRTHATVLATSFLERARVNRVGAQRGDYAFSAAPTGTLKNCRTTSCTTAELSTFDISQWLQEVENTLPAGRAQATYSTSSGRYTLTIFWALREAETETDSSGAVTATEKSMTWVMSP
jgi:type IV pilus assembly protein PilV